MRCYRRRDDDDGGTNRARKNQMRKRAMEIIAGPQSGATARVRGSEEARRRGLRVATPIAFGFHFAQVCVIINPEMEVNVEFRTR